MNKIERAQDLFPAPVFYYKRFLKAEDVLTAPLPE